MSSPELLALRTQVEAAQRAFAGALAAYDVACTNPTLAPTRMQAAQGCRAAGAQYDLTLAILLAYFEQHATEASWTAERERIQQVRATVQRDLARLADPA